MVFGATGLLANVGFLDAPLTQTERDAARELIDAETEELLELAGSHDGPLQLERLAMTIAGALADPSAPAEVPELMVESLEARQGSRGATILGAIARLGSEKPAAMAHQAMERLRERGVEPDLPRGLGERDMEEALLYALGDADLYLVRLRRPGENHVQVGHIGIERRQTGGALVDGMLSEPIAEREAEGLMHRGEELDAGQIEARPVSSEQLAHALGEASNRTRELDMAVEPELSILLAILGRALGMDVATLSHPVVPAGSPLQVEPEDEERFVEISEALTQDFMEWVEETHGAEGPLWRSGLYVADAMLQWKWGYADGDLGRWIGSNLEEFLLDFAPRKLDTDDELIADGPSASPAFWPSSSKTNCSSATLCPRSPHAARSCRWSSPKWRGTRATGASPSRWSPRCSQKGSTRQTKRRCRPGSRTSTRARGRSVTG